MNSVVELKPDVEYLKRRLYNQSFQLWAPFYNRLPKFNHTWDIKKLSNISNINMNSLIDELEDMKTINETEESTPWCEIVLSIVGIIILISLGYVMVKIARKLKYLKDGARDRALNNDQYQIELPNLREESADYETMSNMRQTPTPTTARINRPKVSFSTPLEIIQETDVSQEENSYANQ